MLKLLKYEFIKIINAFLIVLGAVGVLEAMYGIGAVLIKNYSYSNHNGSDSEYYNSFSYALYQMGTQMYGISTALLLVLAFSGIIFVVIFSLVSMNNDFCKKQGYNVFLTPNNAYKILGAKYIVSAVIFVIYAILTFLLTIADINITSWLYDEDLIKIFDDIIVPLIEETGISVVGFAFMFVSILFYYITLAGFSLIFTQTVLKVSGGAKVILQFVVYGVVQGITSTAVMVIMAFMMQFSVAGIVYQDNAMESMNQFFTVSGFAYLIIAVIFYLISSKLIDKKLSL